MRDYWEGVLELDEKDLDIDETVIYDKNMDKNHSTI